MKLFFYSTPPNRIVNEILDATYIRNFDKYRQLGYTIDKYQTYFANEIMSMQYNNVNGCYVLYDISLISKLDWSFIQQYVYIYSSILQREILWIDYVRAFYKSTHKLLYYAGLLLPKEERHTYYYTNFLSKLTMF